MKRLVTILLITTMLMSLVAMAIPTFAATAVASKTPEELKADGYMEIKTEEEFSNISSGKYFLNPDGGVLTLSANKASAVGWAKGGDIEIDGNGATIELAGTQSLFSGGQVALTVKNLNVTGAINAADPSDADATFGDNTHVASIVMHGFKNGVTLDNVHASVDINISGNLSGNVGGLVGKLDSKANLTLRNVSYEGTINTGTGKFTNKSTIGGVVGACGGDLKAESVNVNVTIKAKDSSLASAVGGVAGWVDGNVSLNYVSVAGSIESYRTAPVGGVIGYIDQTGGETVSIKNCSNAASITRIGWIKGEDGIDYNLDDTMNNAAGGIVGGWVANNCTTAITVEGCANSGKINARGDSNGTTGQAGGDTWVGGIIGRMRATGSNSETFQVTISKCSNSGELYTGGPQSAVGGIIGATMAVARITITDCVNTGALGATAANGGMQGQGGILGSYRCTALGATEDNFSWSKVNPGLIISKSVNTGNVSGGNAGGILGNTHQVYAAGLIDGRNGFSITDCINSGEIQGWACAGGIFGSDNLPVDATAGAVEVMYFIGNSLNSGIVESRNSTNNIGVGGIVGMYGANEAKKMTISACANIGEVRGFNYANAIIGYAQGPGVDIHYCSHGGSVKTSTGSGYNDKTAAVGSGTIATNTENNLSNDTANTRIEDLKKGLHSTLSGVKDGGHVYVYTLVGTTHEGKCTVPGCTQTDSVECGTANSWTQSGTTHFKICKICKKQTNIENCSSEAVATCKSLPRCETCYNTYGELAPHEGGTATCQGAAVCDNCGKSYGTAVAHNPGTSWMWDETNHWRECSFECGTKMMSREHDYKGTVCTDCGFDSANPTLPEIPDTPDTPENPDNSDTQNPDTSDTSDSSDTSDTGASTGDSETSAPTDDSNETQAPTGDSETSEPTDDGSETSTPTAGTDGADTPTQPSSDTPTSTSETKTTSPTNKVSTDPTANLGPAADSAPTSDSRDGGCGSSIAGAAVVITAVAALGAGIGFKKKEN